MDDILVQLTDQERAILESYKPVLEGLADYLGSGYEFVLHSLEDLDHSVIKILNGHHTNRQEGAPITDLALSMLSKIRSQERNERHISYFSKNKNDEPLKSCTIAIHGEHGRIIGLLCINLYLDTPFSQFLDSYFPHETEKGFLWRAESFGDSSNDLIVKEVCNMRQIVYNSKEIPANCRNKEIISRLNSMGIFNLKDSVSKAAELLGISKNTVYLHLRNDNQ